MKSKFLQKLLGLATFPGDMKCATQISPLLNTFGFFHKNDPHWNWILNNFGQKKIKHWPILGHLAGTSSPKNGPCSVVSVWRYFIAGGPWNLTHKFHLYLILNLSRFCEASTIWQNIVIFFPITNDWKRFIKKIFQKY